MPITFLDFVKFKLGERDEYSMEDCASVGVALIGSCQVCSATLSIANGYPSRQGYWRCADDIGDDGFATVAEFIADAEGRGMRGCVPTKADKIEAAQARLPSQMVLDIARAINQRRQETRDIARRTVIWLAGDMAEVLYDNVPRFRYDDFYEACGLFGTDVNEARDRRPLD